MHPYFLQMLVWGVLSSLRKGVHDFQGGGRGALQRCMGEKKHVCINFLKYFLRLEEKQKFHSCCVNLTLSKWSSEGDAILQNALSWQLVLAVGWLCKRSEIFGICLTIVVRQFWFIAQTENAIQFLPKTLLTHVGTSSTFCCCHVPRALTRLLRTQLFVDSRLCQATNELMLKGWAGTSCFPEICFQNHSKYFSLNAFGR